VLRDGTHLVGILRSFDQFSNIVLESAVERRFLGKQSFDIPLGLFILRGDNIVLLGAVDEAKEQTELEFVTMDKMKDLTTANKQQLAESKERDWSFDKW
jgi:U6 snRNA-associated Sm-like protein LSm1